jgi:hypothetical protein
MYCPIQSITLPDKLGLVERAPFEGSEIYLNSELQLRLLAGAAAERPLGEYYTSFVAERDREPHGLEE